MFAVRYFNARVRRGGSATRSNIDCPIGLKQSSDGAPQSFDPSPPLSWRGVNSEAVVSAPSSLALRLDLTDLKRRVSEAAEMNRPTFYRPCTTRLVLLHRRSCLKVQPSHHLARQEQAVGICGRVPDLWSWRRQLPNFAVRAQPVLAVKLDTLAAG